MRPCRIALVTIGPTLGADEDNRRLAVRWCVLAAAEGARVVVLPAPPPAASTLAGPLEILARDLDRAGAGDCVVVLGHEDGVAAVFAGTVLTPRLQAERLRVDGLVITGDPVRTDADVRVRPSADPVPLDGSRRPPAAPVAGAQVAVVNLLGGHDGQVFDGGSAVFGPDATVIARAPHFVEHLLAADIAVQDRPGAVEHEIPDLPVPVFVPLTPRIAPLLDHLDHLWAALVVLVRDTAHRLGHHRVTVPGDGPAADLLRAVVIDALGPGGLDSGGLDSGGLGSGGLGSGRLVLDCAAQPFTDLPPTTVLALLARHGCENNR